MKRNYFSRSSFKHALKIASIYGFFSIFFILYSDSFVETIATNKETLSFMQSVKGMFFVTCTTLLIFFLVYSSFKSQSHLVNQLKMNKQRLSHLLNTIPNGIQEYDTEGTITYSNYAHHRILGVVPGSLIGQSIWNFQKNNQSKEELREHLVYLAKEQPAPEPYITTNINKDNREITLEIIWDYQRNDTGVVTGFISVISDITEKRKVEAKLQYQSQYDELTQLPNRNLFIDRLQQVIKQSHRNHKEIAVLFIDLDRFKGINDSLGHNLGDNLLKEVALKLKSNVRETDSIARFGGDEFAVILDNIDDTNTVNDIITNIIDNISRPLDIDGHQLYITASIGVSLYPIDGEVPDILLRNADSAMYKAKDEGGNTYQYYTSEMTTKAFEYVLMESNLRQALEGNEFIIHYQPQVDAEDNHIIGMEALVRWQHPELGMISPAKFIPLAEETGLIIPLGEQIFDIATKQIVKWMKNSPDNYRIAINLSVKQLQQKNIVGKLTEILKTNKCSPEWVELEVTEGYVMKDPELAINTLQHFSDMGVEIAIDDFGTGYSSLSYLKRLPINKLKIDQSFVRDLSVDEDDKAIVESIIYLSKAMKLEVIAEGVETAEQKEFLQKQGCDEIQGYLYCKPVSADKMTKLLASNVINI